MTSDTTPGTGLSFSGPGGNNPGAGGGGGGGGGGSGGGRRGRGSRRRGGGPNSHGNQGNQQGGQGHQRNHGSGQSSAPGDRDREHSRGPNRSSSYRGSERDSGSKGHQGSGQRHDRGGGGGGRRGNRGGGGSGQGGSGNPQRSQQPGQKQTSKQKFSKMDPRYQWDEKNLAAPRPSERPKKYQILIYDTFSDAKADMERLRSTAGGCDQLNIVVRQEGSMDDPELTQFGKVFAGAAWALIHDRRVADGWYNEPH